MPLNHPTTVIYLGDELGVVSILQDSKGRLAQFTLLNVDDSVSLEIDQLEETSFIGVPVVSKTNHELKITRT